ncbi:hypothetical protein QBC43DRAFT_326708 [Cladorrhinum sp. PSN259]|nr:hypothetical protein QBC43DRAFT_326708 [Cladorrhinum sp. PSN259]
MDSPLSQELSTAIDAARQAALISRTALSQAESVASSANRLVKDDLSPVTIADFAIQALLTSRLGAAFPQYGFIGEESADDLRENPALLERVLSILKLCTSSSEEEEWTASSLCAKIDSCTSITELSPTSGRVWIFDPIDGTKSFIKNQQYAINIALVENSRQVLSVVACPLLDMNASYPVTDADLDPTGRGSILFAVRNHGSYIIPLINNNDNHAPDQAAPPPRRLPPADPSTLKSVTCFNSLDSGIDPIHSLISSKLSIPFPGCDLLGWVPRWAALAMGLGNTTIWVYKSRDRAAKIWDHAGAMLLYEEVGGKITDVHGKEIDLSCGRKLKNNFGFVAAPREAHDLVLKAVQDTLREQGKEGLLV